MNSKIGGNMVISQDMFSELYDPIYQFDPTEGGVTPKESLWNFLDPIERERLDLFRHILSTVELQRLKSLNQSGFIGLVFPSATHTRYSHAIGSWTLGRIALENVHMRTHQGISSLRRYLEKDDRVEEFLAAIILDNVGHPPYSHVLNSNQEFQDGLLKVSDNLFKQSPHKQMQRFLTCQLLFGHESRFSKIFRKQQMISNIEIGEDAPCQISTLLTDCRRPSDVSRLLADLNYIRILLGCTNACAAGFVSSRVEIADPLREILDGVVAIGYLDSLIRDAYYTGVGSSAHHVYGLLRHLYIDTTTSPVEVAIMESGVWHAVELLLLHETLWKRVFNNPQVRAYEAMLSTAVSLSLQTGAVTVDDLIFLEDEDLLRCLGKIDICSGLVERIRRKRPYSLVLIASIEQGDGSIEKFSSWIAEEFSGCELPFILGFPRQGNDISSKWLEGIRVVGDHLTGRETIRTSEAKLCDYLAKEREKRGKNIMVFAMNRHLIETHLNKLHQIFPNVSEVRYKNDK